MQKVTNQDIADFTGKKVGSINHWKRISPGLLELCRLGAFCKKNGLSLEDIKSLVELKQKFKD